MSGKTNAIVTASYGPDFERCRVLCETIDAHVTGFTKHYILVDNHDAALFAALAGPKRVIVSDATLLPWWVVRIPGRLVPGGRTVWLSPKTAPLHGWHVQQIRRIAIAHHITEDAMFYCDSDTAFVRPFDLATLWQGDALRLFREPNTADITRSDHRIWLDHAAVTLGAESARAINDNYVTTFIAWRRDVVVAMCDQISKTHKTHWIGPVGRSRKFSECTLYGVFADTLADPALHWHGDKNLCAMQWFDPAPTAQQLETVVANLQPHEIGFGVQSFIPVDLDLFRATALKKR